MGAKIQIKNDSVYNFGGFFSASTISVNLDLPKSQITPWVPGVIWRNTAILKFWSIGQIAGYNPHKCHYLLAIS